MGCVMTYMSNSKTLIVKETIPIMPKGCRVGISPSVGTITPLGNWRHSTSPTTSLQRYHWLEMEASRDITSLEFCRRGATMALAQFSKQPLISWQVHVWTPMKTHWETFYFGPAQLSIQKFTLAIPSFIKWPQSSIITEQIQIYDEQNGIAYIKFLIDCEHFKIDTFNQITQKTSITPLGIYPIQVEGKDGDGNIARVSTTIQITISLPSINTLNLSIPETAGRQYVGSIIYSDIQQSAPLATHFLPVIIGPGNVLLTNNDTVLDTGIQPYDINVLNSLYISRVNSRGFLRSARSTEPIVEIYISNDQGKTFERLYRLNINDQSCVMKGTLIKVMDKRKHVPVEKLRPGDVVYTYPNTKCVVKNVHVINEGTFGALTLLKQNSLGTNTPEKPVFITPNHKILYCGKPIPVGKLPFSITKMCKLPELYHIECKHYKFIYISAGLWIESKH